jgi:hypothetical protein
MAATTAFILRKRCQRKYQQRHKKSDTFFHAHLRELLARDFNFETQLNGSIHATALAGAFFHPFRS